MPTLLQLAIPLHRLMLPTLVTMYGRKIMVTALTMLSHTGTSSISGWSMRRPLRLLLYRWATDSETPQQLRLLVVVSRSKYSAPQQLHHLQQVLPREQSTPSRVSNKSTHLPPQDSQREQSMVLVSSSTTATWSVAHLNVRYELVRHFDPPQTIWSLVLQREQSICSSLHRHNHRKSTVYQKGRSTTSLVLREPSQVQVLVQQLVLQNVRSISYPVSNRVMYQKSSDLQREQSMLPVP